MLAIAKKCVRKVIDYTEREKNKREVRQAKLKIIEMKKRINIGKNISNINEYEQLCKHLDLLLQIYGPSKKEDRVRNYVVEVLFPFVDEIEIDDYGNILAYKSYGEGPNILLNAHLDTVGRVVPSRSIIKNGDIWSSSIGALGADDRAGVAAILVLAEILPSIPFQGTVHFIFTVEEEIGLRGARNVCKKRLQGIDYGIVFDRRGHGDIVIQNSTRLFCRLEYGEFFESIAIEKGLQGWKAVVGGNSDTVIWAESGIESVNLSIGYMDEHTDKEIINVRSCLETVQLVKEFFRCVHELQVRNSRGINLGG